MNVDIESFKNYLKENPLFGIPLDESVAFYKNSRGIPRTKMPQIKGADLLDFVQFMKDNGVSSKTKKVQVKKLKPTQKEYNPEKVDKLVTAPLEVLTRLIIKSKDGFILDGHHRYSALARLDDELEITVMAVDCDIDDLLKWAFKYPKTFTKNLNENDQSLNVNIDTLSLFNESIFKFGNFDQFKKAFDAIEKSVKEEKFVNWVDQSGQMSNKHLNDIYTLLKKLWGSIPK